MEELNLDSTKIMYHQNRVQKWLNGEKIAPITIDCALTRACNYDCEYCFGKLQENTGPRLTRDVVFRFLDDASDIGVKAISFVSDGESTCNPVVYDSINHGKANGLDLALGTNGALLDEGKLEQILGDLTYLRFNISAGDRDRYNKIHGCRPQDYEKVCNNIRKAIEIKKQRRLDTTIGLQMVLKPEYADQVLPLTRLGKTLGVDYLVIKHCSDDELGHLGVDYTKYKELYDLLREAELHSTPDYQVSVKWSKLKLGNRRGYQHCYGPQFLLQMSGSGLVAPCGGLFNDRFKDRFHIGNIGEQSFKDIWGSKRYDDVMKDLSENFDIQHGCESLCLQTKVNEYLNALREGKVMLEVPKGEKPQHINFI